MARHFLKRRADFTRGRLSPPGPEVRLSSKDSGGEFRTDLRGPLLEAGRGARCGALRPGRCQGSEGSRWNYAAPPWAATRPPVRTSQSQKLP